MRWFPSLMLAIPLLFACGTEGSLGGPGATCLRTADCDRSQGLACDPATGMCTTDLAGLAEAGTSPMLGDGGADAAVMDAAPDAPVTDSGPRPDTTPPMDTSVPPDTTPPMDTSVPPDTTPPMDTSVPPDTTPPPADGSAG